MSDQYGDDPAWTGRNQWNEQSDPRVYHGPGGYQQPPDEPSRRSGGPVIVAGVIGALVLVVGGVFAGILLGGRAPATQAAPGSAPTQESAAVEKPAPTGDGNTPGEPIDTAAGEPTRTPDQPPAQTVTVTRTVQPPATSSAPAKDPRIPASGTYVGEASQSATANGGDPKTYRVVMTFSGSGSRVDYPGIGCSGRLVPAGYSGQDRVYQEEITSGHCDDGGTWWVTVHDRSSLSGHYQPRDGDYDVQVELAS